MTDPLSDLPRKWREQASRHASLYGERTLKLCAEDLESALPAHDAAVRAEADARMRELLPCGHPRACEDFSFYDGESNPNRLGCTACASQQRAVAEAVAGAYERARQCVPRTCTCGADIPPATGHTGFCLETIHQRFDLLTDADARRALAKRDKRVREQAVSIALKEAAIAAAERLELCEGHDYDVPEIIRALHDRMMERLKED